MAKRARDDFGNVTGQMRVGLEALAVLVCWRECFVGVVMSRTCSLMPASLPASPVRKRVGSCLLTVIIVMLPSGLIARGQVDVEIQ